MSETARPPLLAMRGIRKSFGNVTVLKGVDFAARAGEIHALMGENGAGKSTLMKIAGGIYPDYEGEIAIDGVPVRFQGTRDATRHGVAVIHQELNLVPGMTVADNIFLGSEMVRGPFFVDRRRQLQAAAELLEPLNFRASPATLVGSLRVGEQQLVEIAKSLSLHTRILIMDEPTSALSVSEALRLHEIIRRLAGEGVAVVYISHRMEEIFELCHSVTVLRDGALVGSVPIGETSRSGLIRMMAGRDVQEFFHRGDPGAASDVGPTVAAHPVLSVRGLWLANPKPTALRPRLVDGVDLDVAAGEVVGLAGLMGAGRTELLETLFGARSEPSGGEVRVDGRPVVDQLADSRPSAPGWHWSPRTASATAWSSARRSRAIWRSRSCRPWRASAWCDGVRPRPWRYAPSRRWRSAPPARSRQPELCRAATSRRW